MTIVPRALRHLNFDDNSSDDIEIPMTPINRLTNEIDESMVPKVGLEFESEEAAYRFYNAYAEKAGFSIRRSKIHTSKSGAILDRTFVCSCEGKRASDKRDDDIKQHRPETRFDCKAKLGVSSRSNGKYRIYTFISEHSHDLISPSKSHFLRSHRSLTDTQKFQIDMAQSSGIAPKESMDLLTRQAGGRENVGFIRDDYKNYLRTKRTIQMKFGDTGGVLEYLQKKQAEDPNFTYAIQVDVEDLITNIFWADARMKVDYDRFGDVVCFDTTYRKNKEGRPLALFVGVNHHKQTIIFGGALLYDETIETFEWLFDTFARTMSGRKPNTILTDQDAAMDKALSTQWPETKHRLCVWHMYQNAAKHLSGVFDKFKSFAKEFSSCVYDHDEISEFTRAWDDMLEKYNLKDNEWLKKLYENKEKWALVYGRQTFSADMSTTQRSESMNNKVKDYISYKHDLLQFFEHFQSLLDDRRYDESKADTKSSISMPALPYPVEILKHAASVYTLEVFKIFHEEVWKTWNCNVEILQEVQTLTEYKVTPEKPHSHIVKFDSCDCSITCSCKKFDFVGILCSHSLKIFFLKNIKRVPECYIKKRWTKAAKVTTTSLAQYCSIDGDPKVATGRRYKELSYFFNKLAARAAEMEETYEIGVAGYNRILEDVEARIKKMGVKNDKDAATPTDETDELEVSQVDRNQIVDGLSDEPRIKGIKVKPKKNKVGSSRRFMSALEKATRKKSSKNKLSASRTTKTSEKISKVNHNHQNNPLLQSDFGGMSGSHHTHQDTMYRSNSLAFNLNSPYFGSATEALMQNSSIQPFGSSVPSSYISFPSQHIFRQPYLSTMQNQSTMNFTWTSDDATYGDLSNLQNNFQNS